MKTEHRKSWRILISGLAFVLLVSAFFFVLIVRITPESLPSMSPDEIARLDLSAQTACIDRGDTQWYPGELLEPPDFALGEHAALRSDARFGTNRVVLSLPAGKTYGITGSSCSYAQKLWINGALVSQVGQVSDSPDGFVPRTDEYTVYFTPETDTTEIIVQRAHFNHRSGYFNKVYLAEEQIIAQRNRRQFISDGLMLGALLSIAIFFLGMVLFYTRRLSLLWFSLACLCSALHYMTFRGKAFALLFPDLSWYLSHKLEYLAQYSFYLFVLLFAFSILEVNPPRWLQSILLGLLGAVFAFYAVLPSTVYTLYKTQVMAVFALTMIGTYVYLLVRFIRERLFQDAEKTVVCATAGLVVLCWCMEAATYLKQSWYIQPYVTLLFIFLNAVVLTISFSRAERLLDTAKQKEREITETNAMLSRMNTLKTDFMHNLAHEMKTPLTVMSGYAQLTSWQLSQNATDAETPDNLKTISAEAQRLSELVTKLLSLTYAKEITCPKSRVSMGELLADAAAVCRPILQKNGNELAVCCADVPDTAANHDMLIQVLVNLTVNANRHTQNGRVSFSAEAAGETLLLRVSDTGSGVRSADKPHIFERGYSTDGGSGIGLALCRDVVEGFGGAIQLEKTDATGSTFLLTLPIWKEG